MTQTNYFGKGLRQCNHNLTTLEHADGIEQPIRYDAGSLFGYELQHADIKNPIVDGVGESEDHGATLLQID